MKMNMEAKPRYLEKISMINGIDPYGLSNADKSSDEHDLPNVGYLDMINYLVWGKSAYTLESFKSVRSLQAYNQYKCGWVSNVTAVKINGLTLVLGKVCVYYLTMLALVCVFCIKKVYITNNFLYKIDIKHYFLRLHLLRSSKFTIVSKCFQSLKLNVKYLDRCY